MNLLRWNRFRRDNRKIVWSSRSNRRMGSIHSWTHRIKPPVSNQPRRIPSNFYSFWLKTQPPNHRWRNLQRQLRWVHKWHCWPKERIARQIVYWYHHNHNKLQSRMMTTQVKKSRLRCKVKLNRSSSWVRCRIQILLPLNHKKKYSKY